MSTNPVHQNTDDKWYFWDEYWVFEKGPYDTEELANEACKEYGKRL